MEQKKTANHLIEILWFILFLLLPITSFPPLAKLAGGTMVAPPAMAVLFVLVLVWFIPYVFRGKPIPRHNLLLLAFAGGAVISSLASLYLPIPAFQREQCVEKYPRRHHHPRDRGILLPPGFYLVHG